MTTRFKDTNLSLLDKPDIIILCEIRTVTASFIRAYFEKLGYDVILKIASGVVIAAKFKLNMIRATKSIHDSILAGCIKIGNTDLTIIAAYGPQETEKASLRTEFYEEIGIEIQACIDRCSQPILVGDLNAKIILDNNVISSISPSGTLLKDVVVQYDLKVLNFSAQCTGKWTRSQCKKGIVERSIIDYVITSDSLSGFLDKLAIDEDRIISPYWIKKTKKSGDLRKFSDHNALLFSLTIPRNNCSSKKACSDVSGVSGWYITTDGLDEFRLKTEITPQLPVHENDIFASFNDYMTSLMDSCFRRKKSRTKKHPNVVKDHIIQYKPLCVLLKIFVNHMQKGRIERHVAKKYIVHIQDVQNQLIQKQRSIKIAETMGKLTDEHGQMTVDKFWKLKKSLTSQDQSKTSIISRDNVELFSPAAIKKEYEVEFLNRLSRRTIDPAFKTFEDRSQVLFNLMLKYSSQCEEEPDFSVEEVWNATLSLNSPSSAGPNQIPPDVFVKAGRGFFIYLTLVLNTVKRKLYVPTDWYDLLIVTLFKNKGSRKLLEFYRGIFLSNVLPKILEKLIKGRINMYLKKVNLLQGGSRDNRSVCDNNFLLNGVIDHAKYLNKQVFITFYDYSTCFDSLWLEDSMITLWDLGVRNELFALIYKLNETAKIRVKTPFGLTDEFECERIVKQGTVLSSNLCSSSTAQLCDFNITGGTYTGSFVINDLLYVDDTIDVNDEVNETVSSHHEVLNFSKCKRLGVNHKKCGHLTVNKKAHHHNPTLTIGDGIIPQVSCTKSLGDMVNEKGNNRDLIDDKVKNAKAAIINCLSMCNEVILGLFFVTSAIILYESVFLATLLSNCQTWRNLNNEDYKKLEITQLRYLKRVMKAPLSTPNAFVLLEFGALPVKRILHIRQLSFLHHIVCLDSDDPVRKMFESQQQLPFEKNWANEVIPLLDEYLLSEYDIRNMSKPAWKEIVKVNVTHAAMAQLSSDIKFKTKTKHLSYNFFNSQPYMHHFSHKQASIIFKLRSFSIDCKGNRKSANNDITCRLCKAADETQQHVINCPLVRVNGTPLDLSKVLSCDFTAGDKEILEICRRVDEFNKLVNETDN